MSRIHKIKGIFKIENIVKDYQLEISNNKFYNYELLVVHNILLKDVQYLTHMIIDCLYSAYDNNLIKNLKILNNGYISYKDNKYTIDDMNAYYDSLKPKYYKKLIIGKFDNNETFINNFSIFEEGLYNSIFQTFEEYQVIYTSNLNVDINFYNWNNRFKKILVKDIDEINF